MQNVMAEQQTYSDNSLLLNAREQPARRVAVIAGALVPRGGRVRGAHCGCTS